MSRAPAPAAMPMMAVRERVVTGSVSWMDSGLVEGSGDWFSESSGGEGGELLGGV